MTKFYKIMFLSMLILSTLISISSYSWMGMWIGLEINVLSIIPLLIFQNNKISSESSIKYFITQTIASTTIMMSIIMMMWEYNFNSSMINNSSLLIMNSSLLMKMGMAPFHFWFPEVLEGLSWDNSMLMLTWQKIAPMVLLMYNIEFSMFMSIIIISSMIISGVMAINQISLRKIMAYSSINHMGWMIGSMILSQNIWITYFIIYSFLSINLILVFNWTKSFFISQINNIWTLNPAIKIFFMMNFLSLAGIPPLIGFFPKWITVQIMIMNELYLTTFFMIMFTLVMIYVYISIAMSSMMFNSLSTNWNFNLNFKFNSMMSMINFIILFSLIFITIAWNFGF